MSARSDRRPEQAAPRWLERAIFWLSLLVVLGVASALVLLDPPWRPDTVAVAPKVGSVAVTRDQQAFVVNYELENLGTASVVQVQVQVTAGDQQVEQTIAYLPNGSKQRASAVLYGVPAGTRPEVRVVGYQMP